MPKPRQHYAFVATKWMTGSSYVTFVTSAVNSVIITHALGPQGYGVYSYVVWMITFVVGLVSSGLNITAIRAISAALGKDASTPSSESLHIFALLRRTLYKILALAAVALWVSTLFPKLYPSDLTAHLYIYIAFVLLCSAAKASYMFSVSASKGFMVFETEAIGNMATGVATPLIGLLLLYTHQGLPAFLGLLGASILAQLGLASLIMRRRGLVAAPQVDTANVGQRVGTLFRWNILLSLVSQFSPKSIDTYLLGYLSLTVAVGQYNIASNLSRAGTDVLVAGFSAMLLPYISRVQAEEGMTRLQDVFIASACVYQAIGLVVAGSGYFLANFIILALYGNAFSQAIPALQVMTAMGGIGLPLGAYSAVLIATDSVRLRMAYIVGMTLISLTTSLTLVPRLGYSGALISILFGGTLSYIFAITLTYLVIGLRFPLRQIAVQWLCAISVAFTLTEVVPQRSTALPAIASSAAFAVVFVALSINFGGWRSKDLQAAARQSPLLARLLGLVWLTAKATNV